MKGRVSIDALFRKLHITQSKKQRSAHWWKSDMADSPHSLLQPLAFVDAMSRPSQLPVAGLFERASVKSLVHNPPVRYLRGKDRYMMSAERRAIK